MTKGTDADGNTTFTVDMNEGPDNNRFGYPTATLVVKNKNGTTTAYTGVIFNIAQNIASYIRGKWGIDSSSGNETAVLSDSQAAITVNITTHVNSSGALSDLSKANITTLRPSNWSYTGDYLQSIIQSVTFTGNSLNTSTIGDSTQNVGTTITFTDGSSISGGQATVHVIGGQAQSGLSVSSGARISFVYPDASSGITTDSQSNIAQWAPTYDWVYDANGTALDDTHQYNTTYSADHTSFTAYVKITYHKSTTDSTTDGTQIVPVTININQNTIASTEGQGIWNHIDHITSHPISAGTASGSTSSSWSADVDANGKPNLNQYTWGIDPAQIVWTSDTTDAEKADYLSKIGSLIATNEHSFPAPTTNSDTAFTDGTGSGYIVSPGLTMFFTDGSSMGSGKPAWIYKPKQVTDSTAKTDFKTGDLSQFDSTSAATHVNNVLPSSDYSFDASYQWVVKEDGATYTFPDAIDMRNTNQWVTNTNGQWGVANPSNSTGTKGVTITGYRALTADDIKDAGTKQFYVLIGYTKNAKSGSTAGTYDGYYVVPAAITLNLQGKIAFNSDNSQTETYKGSGYSTSDLVSDNFTKFVDTNDTPNESVTLTPTSGYELSADDYIFEQNGTEVTNPTNVGTYDVYLKQSGINKIKKWTNASNYDWTGISATDPVKVGTFNIVPAQASATLSGSGTKTYDGTAVSDANIQASDNNNDIKLTLNVPNESNPSFTLAAGDFNWYATDAQGNKTGDALTSIPSDAGTYYLELNSNGIQAIKDKFGSNYTWTDGDATDTDADNQITGHATYTINPKTLTVSQTGSSNKTYTGSALSPDISDVLAGLKATDGTTLDTTGIDLSDFTWAGTDSTHTNAGTYTLTLSSDGLTKLQKDNPNYAISSVSGSYTFTIDSNVTFEFVDDDYTGTGSNIVSSQSQGMPIGTSTTISPALTVPDKYQLASGQTLPTSYTVNATDSNTNNPVVQIHLVHQTQDVSDTDTDAQHSRQITVHYVYGAGDNKGQAAAPDAVLDVYFHRTATKDLVTGHVTYGNWQFGNTFNGTYNGMTFTNGYSVPEGSTKWNNLPTSWGIVTADVPTVEGYTVFTNGDWTLNSDGTQSTVPANEFVYPSFNTPGLTDTSLDSTAYTSASTIYEAMADHTIYYIPTTQTETRTVTEHYRYWENGADAGEAATDN